MCKPKHMIYYFSGTGNCLQVAKAVAATLGLEESAIQSMGVAGPAKLDAGCESVGFVYPTYFLGVPLAVRRFVQGLDVSGSTSAYFYAITTMGGMAGNALPQLGQLLKDKGAQLHYGAKLAMFSNYVVMYKMGTKVQEKAEQAAKDLVPILADIQARRTNATPKPAPIFECYHHCQSKRWPNMDKHYHVSDACVSCGLCRDVCPVQNIQLAEGKPVFAHRCEQCTACIQFCPKQAINYKQATQSRGRYTNPTISHKELAKYNKGQG